MSDKAKPAVGSIVWRDLTVADAESVRDFYRDVVGWQPAPVSMGQYDDYNMVPPGGGDPVTGICHARGVNESLPPQWLMYIAVEDITASMERCTQRGGKVIDGPRTSGDSSFCVIQDPAGAIVALVSG